MDLPVAQLLSTGMHILFFILLLFFSIHAIFLTYHWFTFGTSKKISTTALALYLFGGAVLLITYSLALNNL